MMRKNLGVETRAMRAPSRRLFVALVLASVTLAPQAKAAMAVVDVDAIAQLATQIDTLREQLVQAQAAYQAITGGRGMESLLAGTPRNYLPPDWAANDSAASRSFRTALAESSRPLAVKFMFER